MKNERCHCTREKVERRKLNLESNRRPRNLAPLLCSLTQAQWLRGSSTALQLQVYVAPLRISMAPLLLYQASARRVGAGMAKSHQRAKEELVALYIRALERH